MAPKANDLDTIVGNPEGEAYLDKMALDFVANLNHSQAPALPASEVVDLDRSLSPTICRCWKITTAGCSGSTLKMHLTLTLLVWRKLYPVLW